MDVCLASPLFSISLFHSGLQAGLKHIQTNFWSRLLSTNTCLIFSIQSCQLYSQFPGQDPEQKGQVRTCMQGATWNQDPAPMEPKWGENGHLDVNSSSWDCCKNKQSQTNHRMVWSRRLICAYLFQRLHKNEHIISFHLCLQFNSSKLSMQTSFLNKHWQRKATAATANGSVWICDYMLLVVWQLLLLG